MLKMVTGLRDLDFGALMEVYREGNLENGAELWPEEPEGRRLQLAEESFYRYLREGFFPVPGAVYALWREEGACVSALRLEPYRDGTLLEALETRPDVRNRGYAGRLLEAVALWLEGQGGTKLYSHVSRRNAVSLAVHGKCGFRQVLDYAVYVDGSVNRRAVTLLRTIPGES